MTAKPSHLILNSPFEEPLRHWEFVRESLGFRVADGRRKSGYVMATPGAKGFEDPGQFKEIGLVNQIRPRVNAWREAGYPGVTLETKKLWDEAGSPTPPVMITVANRTETAARIKFAFDRKKVLIEELCDPARTLHIDSKVLRETESAEDVELADDKPDEDEEAAPKLTKKQRVVFEAVNAAGVFGVWSYAVCEKPQQVLEYLHVG